MAIQRFYCFFCHYGSNGVIYLAEDNWDHLKLMPRKLLNCYLCGVGSEIYHLDDRRDINVYSCDRTTLQWRNICIWITPSNYIWNYISGSLWNN